MYITAENKKRRQKRTEKRIIDIFKVTETIKWVRKRKGHED